MSGKQSQRGVNIMDTEGMASPEPKRRRAAQYVRMSTEHQQYSTENQSDVTFSNRGDRSRRSGRARKSAAVSVGQSARM